MVKLDPIVSESVADAHIRCFHTSIARKRDKRDKRGECATHDTHVPALVTIHVRLRSNRLIERNRRVVYVLYVRIENAGEECAFAILFVRDRQVFFFFFLSI